MAIEFLPVPPAPKQVVAGREYRELTPEEIQSIAHVFAATGNPLPDPATSMFVGAVQDGKVVGFLTLQLKLHAQPMWIEDGHSEAFRPLVHAAEKAILEKAGPQWVYLFAPAGKLSQLAQTMGMALEPWCVLSKLVAPEMPQQGTIELIQEAPEIKEPTEAELPFQNMAMATVGRSETIQ